MTRKEAITSYEKLYAYMVGDDDAIELDYGEFMELNHYIRTALRPVSREQMEKVWRGEWTTDGVCRKCGFDAMYYDGVPVQVHTNFCPHCGAPMTDEAVEMVMERMEALKGE